MISLIKPNMKDHSILKKTKYGRHGQKISMNSLSIPIISTHALKITHSYRVLPVALNMGIVY